MKTVLFLLLLGFAEISSGQLSIHGMVIQADSLPLPYTNIGIKLKNIGTVSDENGDFHLVIPQQFFNDTLTFSYVGFEELNVPLTLIRTSSKMVFVLDANTSKLGEVVITNKNLKQKKIGTKSHNPFLFGSAVSKDKGDVVEFAKLININDRISRIQTANIYLLGVNIDTATFRINFYESADGLPGEKIVDKNIIRRMSIKKGWLIIDLRKEDIVLDKDFFIGFEFMPEMSQQKDYSFSYGGQIGGSCIFRKSSLGTWEREKGASLSAYVVLQQ